jgi:hypothetical protein
MVGHLLRDLQTAAVLQIRRDAGRAEAVAAHVRPDVGGLGAFLNRALGVLLP